MAYAIITRAVGAKCCGGHRTVSARLSVSCVVPSIEELQHLVLLQVAVLCQIDPNFPQDVTQGKPLLLAQEREIKFIGFFANLNRN